MMEVIVICTKDIDIIIKAKLSDGAEGILRQYKRARKETISPARTSGEKRVGQMWRRVEVAVCTFFCSSRHTHFALLFVASLLLLFITTMAEVPVAIVATCSNPGCDQPGTKSCSACKITVYCCVICQTADWVHHKEVCDGHLRKVGVANLAKAVGFQEQHNWGQTLHYGGLAATKLKQLKDRRLETVELINNALVCKFNALTFMGRHREAKECAEERYTLWAMNHIRNAGSMRAALDLIQSCIHTGEYEDAEHYARHAYFMTVGLCVCVSVCLSRPSRPSRVVHKKTRRIFNPFHAKLAKKYSKS